MSCLPTTTDLNTLIRKNKAGKPVAPIQWYKIENCFQDELDTYPEEIRKLYEYVEETRTYKIPEYVWLKWREHAPDGNTPMCIGGSSIAALFDGSELSKCLQLYEGQHASKYNSCIELWYEKVGLELPLTEKKCEDILWLGHNEESSIRALFKKNFEADHPEAIVEVINDTHMYQNAEHPYCLCDLDGIVSIDGVKGVLECKTCQFTSEDYHIWKSGCVPLKYYLQVCWYMMCMNYPYAYVCCKTGIGTSDVIYIYVERNFEIEDMLIDMVDKFQDLVLNKVEPDLTDQDIDRVYKFWRRKMGNIKPDAPIVELDPSLKEVLVKINSIGVEEEQLQQRIVELQEEKKRLLVNNIFPVFGSSTYGTLSINDDEYMKIKLKNARAKQSVLNEEKLKAENPEIYQKYIKVTPKFNSTLFKKEQKLLYEQYIVPDSTLTEAKENYCEITVEKKNKKGA